MPMINLSATVNSGRFVDQFAIVRRAELVNNFGYSGITPKLLSGYGTVYPSNENDLKRFPDLQIQSKALTVITQTPLYGEAESQGTELQPDIVIWNGDNFVVRAIEDYSRYGQGFIFAICSSIDLVDSYAIPAGIGGFGVGDMGNRGMGE